MEKEFKYRNLVVRAGDQLYTVKNHDFGKVHKSQPKPNTMLWLRLFGMSETHMRTIPRISEKTLHLFARKSKKYDLVNQGDLGSRLHYKVYKMDVVAIDSANEGTLYIANYFRKTPRFGGGGFHHERDSIYFAGALLNGNVIYKNIPSIAEKIPDLRPGIVALEDALISQN